MTIVILPRPEGCPIKFEAYRRGRFDPNQMVWVQTLYIRDLPLVVQRGSSHLRTKWARMAILSVSDDPQDRQLSQKLKQEMIDEITSGSSSS